MRKLIVTEFMTLDGPIGAPTWSFPYWGDDIAAFKGAETDGGDTILLGRVTYEGFAQAWPPQGDDEASGARYFNNVEKIVNGHFESTTTRAELREYIEYVKEFVQTVQAGKKAGKTTDQVGSEWKTPARFKGYEPMPVALRVKADAELIYKETK